MVEPIVLRNNRWRCDHGWDIDLDDGSSRYVIRNNLCLNGGIKLREGFYRVVENNIVVNNSFHPHVWYGNSQDIFRRNIVFGPYRPIRVKQPWGQECDRNLLHVPGRSGASPAGGLQRQSGLDAHSIEADAQFVDPSKGDYRVREGSPALELGFKNFPMDRFGMRRPRLRAIARSPELPTYRAVASEPPAQGPPIVWQGARLRNLVAGEYSALGVGRDAGGVVAAEVPAGSEAARLGLRSNDVIRALNGRPVRDAEDFAAEAAKVPAGSPVRLDVIRNQRSETLETVGPLGFRFSFGPGPAPSGYTRVSPDAAYSRERGYGFEGGAEVTAVEREGTGFCTSRTPYFFSIAVPEGNYRVTVTLPGDGGARRDDRQGRAAAADAGAGAGGRGAVGDPELRRQRAYPEDRRDRAAGPPEGPAQTTDEAWAWDEKLTLEFNGPRPCLESLRIEKVELPTVFILGDSTVCDQSREPYASWGQMLPRFFKPEVAVANHAESGESLASSAGSHRLEKVLSLMKGGDYLLIQYGHNDMKSKQPDASQAYKATLKGWVRQVKERGGIPVLITPMNRHTFEGGTVTNSLREYPEMVRQTAAEEDVALIDLNATSKMLYEALGPRESIRLFKHNADLTQFDGTHHSPYGAYELARCVVEGIRRSRPDLARHLADDVPAFDPRRPDPEASVQVPSSPQFSDRRPLGD